MKKLIILSVCGIAAVYFATLFSSYETREISSLGKLDYGARVCVSGFVSDLYKRSGLAIFSVTDNSSVKAVLFENTDISKLDNITVCGRVDYYNGELEIKAHKIIK